MKKYFQILLMFGLVLALAVVALAQTAQPVLLWGWNPQIVSIGMGVIGSILSSVLMHVHWADKIKQWFVFGIALVLTAGVGIYSKNISLSSVNATNLGDIAGMIFFMTHLTYLAFSPSLNALQRNVNPGNVTAPASLK